ncbi:MAG: sigma-70 family RNA polymerase sigma factor [Chloroflexi bacterium]|nr:MAG: sigma-70 family RNA polymerase sigma factor [Chloroflexota bacterium]TME65556.1 MAG: sigma-70 family RNA polymerase sigma factor [Chloroflexota bacterium]
MIERDDDLWPQINAVANQAVRSCALGILTTDALAQQILLEWKARRKGDEPPSHGLLRRIALRICSRALCEAWRSPQHEVRNAAYENLRRYLERSLRSTGYAYRLQQDTHAVEDVLHQALEELYLSITRNLQAGPADPASFLKWAQTIVIRQAHAYVQKRDKDSCLSIENQQELYNEIPSDEQHHDPQQQIERQELRQTLKDAILSLRNRNYQQVLLYTYFADMDESEMASHLHVPVQEIYMWRYRALRALRKKPEIMQLLQIWRE